MSKLINNVLERLKAIHKLSSERKVLEHVFLLDTIFLTNQTPGLSQLLVSY